MAEHFQRAGWRVERCETHAGFRTSSIHLFFLILTLCYGYWLWRALRQTLPGWPAAGRGALVLLGFALLAVVVRVMVGDAGSRVFRERSPHWDTEKRKRKVNVVASRNSDARVRVVFVSHLDNPAHGTREDLAWTAALLAIFLFTHFDLPRVWASWGTDMVWAGLILWGTRRWLRVASPGLADNRTGLAILAEMAEAFPPRLHERVDVQLAAVGASGSGQLGALTLAEAMRSHWPEKPTLVVNLECPGLGPRLVIIGKGEGVELACAAARDLWIPHRAARWPYRALDHRAFQLCRIPGLTVAGDRHASRIDPASFSACTQLASEIALRWARAHEAPAQPASPVKSSQKPG
jgi:hypothetical protein